MVPFVVLSLDAVIHVYCAARPSTRYPMLTSIDVPKTEKSRLSAFCLFQFVYFASDSRENI